MFTVVSTKWLEERCVRLRVVVKADNCGDAQDCSAKGVCFTNGSMEGYECQCCAGFVGAHCEEQDACYPSPCENHGICVDISQGHEGTTFQCLCPYGFLPIIFLLVLGTIVYFCSKISRFFQLAGNLSCPRPGTRENGPFLSD
ncbi:Hypothetical predicted protein [Cloeon dipterum]|uniref:EGF-like domain-containing protein n=1 Tax=Cloeon dipterum TaxID=197152 RepID=A0A8S1DCG3_9INSE|nr:Hypothetical predicted protein [Cloeon dipterum]